MSTLSKRDLERSLGRAGARRSKRNRLFWTGAAESARLEPRTMLSLTVTTFQIPLVALVEPQGIATGPDGNLWFTENGAGKIGRMTQSGAVTSFALPQVPPPAGSLAGTASTTPHLTAITAGPDGALWFTGIPGEIGRITATGVVTEFPLPAVPPPAGSKPGTASMLATATAITAGPDGALWFTGVPGDIGRITTSGAVTEFAVPDIPPPAGSRPDATGTLATATSITTGPDGALWFGENGAIGRITTTGTVQQFSLSGSPSVFDITAGPDGALWFTGVGGEVGRMTTAGLVTEFDVGNASTSSVITTGPDGNLWVTESTGPLTYTSIGRITPKGIVTTFKLPGDFSTVGGLTAGPGGNVWFTEEEDGSTPGEQPGIGEITPAGAMTLHPIAQGTTLDPALGVPISPNLIKTAPNGTIWFSENGAIGRVNGARLIQQYVLPTPALTITAIAPAPDGSLWFTQQNPDLVGPDAIGHVSVKGVINEYPLPTDVTVGQSITVGPDADAWFTENVNDPDALTQTVIGRLTPEGAMSTFTVPVPSTAQDETLGAIAKGPYGNVWFTGDYTPANGANNQSFIGRITARGQIRVFELPPSFSSSSSPYGGFYTDNVSTLISGPNGRIWFAANNAQGVSGIAQISTRGKLGSFIPAANISGDLVAGPDGQIWFPNSDPFFEPDGWMIATRSGVVATQDLPRPVMSFDGFYGLPYVDRNMAAGRRGSLWFTYGSSSIVRVSGLDAVAGGLDYRHRPERAPDYGYWTYQDHNMHHWTNTTSNPRPTFAGVAKPGAEVTLWAQKQGQNRPILVGHATASKSDGSWTLTSRVKLSNGDYAVTASQTGDTGPPSMLYSLEPDSSGNLSNALVIQAPHGSKRKG